MGLIIHSLGELPANAKRAYYVYLLDYGWDEPLGEVLFRNFNHMARIASSHDAVVLRGIVGSHFVDEVLSHHHVDGQPGEEVLPAILITTRNPHEFRNYRLQDHPDVPLQHRMLLIPLRKFCKSSTEVVDLINKVFNDIQEKKELKDFSIAKKLKQGKNGALVDALILQPNFSGIGINLNKIINFFRGKED